ncbi:MAG: HEAT repeat domain-containing protein [Deltaproteobacteria bacterium]|nr:HEAT repeat domain-containing protein [Deltaproteobacteria bacterium]
MTRAFKIDKSLRERRRIIRLLDFLKRDDLTGDQMERIGRRLQKSGRRALQPLVRKLWQEKNGTAIYRYTCMLDFFDDAGWLDQLVQITLKRKDLEEDGRLALLDALQDYGIDVTAPPFAGMTGYGAATIDGFVADCLNDGERGLVRFMDMFLDAGDDVRERMIRRLSEIDSPDAVALLEILVSFERPEVVREAIIALGRIKSGFALDVLNRAEKRHEGAIAELIKRSIRRLSFVGIREPVELPRSFPVPLPFHQVQAGPIDIYGSRSLWFAWRLADSGYAALVLLTGEEDGLINALSYRLKDDKEYDGVLKEIAAGELLEPVEPGYALALLRDALFRSREHGYYLPPDFYVDMRMFSPDALLPEAYIPRFSLAHLDGIVERIPGYVAGSNELLDNASLEGWLLSESAVYDAAERLDTLERNAGEDGIPEADIEAELARFCAELITPRRAEIIKRLLLTADFMQHTGSDERTVQHTLATALSLVGGFLPEARHPFIRRLILDSIETARQALAEGYDLRLEEGYDDEE